MTPDAEPTRPPTVPLLRVEQLALRHGARSLFRRLDFVWPTPALVCVRGPNGSGKTSLLKLLAGAWPPDRGRVVVAGHDLAVEPARAARQLAFVPDDCPVYPFLVGREWLAFTAGLHASAEPALADWVDRFALARHLDTRFGAMSLGTARKFMLAAALATEVPLLVLDEPTNGLDAASFDAFADGLAERRSRSLVVLTCHDTQQQAQLGALPVALAALESG